MIARVQSPWSSSLVLVRKPDGSWRVCSNYKKLNAVTVKDCYPLPRIDTILNSLQGATWFSAHVMTASFWQTSMNTADGNVDGQVSSYLKTAFTTSDGQFAWKKMPFGLLNASAHQQRLMDKILGTLAWRTVVCYVDDCTVFSASFQEHLLHLRQFYQRLRRRA